MTEELREMVYKELKKEGKLQTVFDDTVGKPLPATLRALEEEFNRVKSKPLKDFTDYDVSSLFS